MVAHSRRQVHVEGLVQTMQEILNCPQKANAWACNSDTFVDSIVIVYPIHTEHCLWKEILSQHRIRHWDLAELQKQLIICKLCKPFLYKMLWYHLHGIYSLIYCFMSLS